MTVNKYRKQHPKCRYCEYSMYLSPMYHCDAKEKLIVFDKAAKCPLYKPVRWNENAR
jgi:hypothetical protein